MPRRLCVPFGRKSGMGIVSGGDVWRERPQRYRQMKAEKNVLMEESRFLRKGIVPTHVDCLGITDEGLAK